MTLKTKPPKAKHLEGPTKAVGLKRKGIDSNNVNDKIKKFKKFKQTEFNTNKINAKKETQDEQMLKPRQTLKTKFPKAKPLKSPRKTIGIKEKGVDSNNSSAKIKKFNKFKQELDATSTCPNEKYDQELIPSITVQAKPPKAKPQKVLRKTFGIKQKTIDSNNPKIKKFETFKQKKFDAHNIAAHQDAKHQLLTPKTEGEKPDWKKLKQEQKKLTLKRKLKKCGGNEVYELGIKVKQIWEELRREDCTGERKKKLSQELYKVIKGKAKLLVYAHDTVRVIETLVGVGGETYRAYLFVELKDELLNMCKNKYSRCFVIKLLRSGTKEQRNLIMKAMEGHIVSLMKHRIACDVVELAYNDYANAAQRSSMVQEFYGPRFRLFKENISTLSEVLEKYPDSKERILKEISKALHTTVEKGVFTNILIHTLLKEYLEICEEQERTPLIDNIKENLLPIIHTRDGARVAMICLWFGTSKDRKVIMKSFKGNYQKIAMDEHGHMVLLAAFDAIDDTVLIKKIIFPELIRDFDQLAENENGRKVIRYMVAPRSKTFFHPMVLAILEKGDKNPHSKKDNMTKFNELQNGENGIADPMLNLILKNIKRWSYDPKWTILVGAALNNLKSNVSVDIYEAIAEMCAQPFIPGGEQHFIESACMCKMVSYLIQTDKERHRDGRPLFSCHLLTIADSEMRGWILANRGCFTLVRLLETEIPDVVRHVKAICSTLKQKLKKLEFPGAQILLNKIQ